MRDDLPALLEERIARYKRRDRLNYVAAYLVLGIAVLSSGLATFIVAIGWKREVAAILSALPGVIVLANNTFRFEQRAAWYWKRRLLLEGLLRSLRFEGADPGEISRLWNNIDRDTFTEWPAFGSVPGSGEARTPAPNNAVERPR